MLVIVIIVPKREKENIGENMQMEKEKQIEKLKIICLKYKVETDLIDWNALVDATLEFSENERQIVPLIEALASSNDFEEKTKTDFKTEKKTSQNEKEEKSRLDLENIKKEIEHTETEFKKSIENLKMENNSEILAKLYYYPKQYTKVVMNNNNDINAGLFTGKLGQGKSINILQALNEEKVDYVYKQGVTSPLSLYIFLYEHRKDNIVFDDNNAILTNDNAVGIILNALYNASGKREVGWDSTTGKLKNTPSSFIFEGKIIIITNELPKKLNSDLIKSRCICYNFDFNNYEILAIMGEIAKIKHLKLSEEERGRIFSFIRENVSEATLNFDLRVQRTIENLYLYDKDNWKELSKPLFNGQEKNILLLKQLIREVKDNAELRERWHKETGLSERQLYRTKSKLFSEEELKRLVIEKPRDILSNDKKM